jgi:TRAP-type C4-dicarboxylate transport system permease small subunit
VAILFLTVLTWQGVAMVIRTVYQVSPTLEISMRWVYLSIPVGGLLMLFHLLTALVKTGLSENPLFSFQG